MDEFNPEETLKEISAFLQRWFPPEVAPLVVKKQLNATGADPNNITMKDIDLLLGRLQMVILPSFMSPAESRREISKLRRKIGVQSTGNF